ncbi:hypothetical protein AKJ54_00245 [candidate division MSBL1 archaeon SCGC-AAA382K21]|uniref:NYN domain-containing protein n=1 Tax=candidate division MSBL1 archaeon SCGC-AAA382K21 TaxID=1698283 RepID=A0A133VLY5_9EURY|nr:hypothetical protein AKJ54_00245 [candidate division MSBL1 archaeon SCGC-AAA382K21]
MKEVNSSENNQSLAAFIDNDNIFKSVKSCHNNPRGYDIEKVVEYLNDEGDLRFGRIYFNPGDFQGKRSLLHKFNENLIEPVFTDSYDSNGETKSLADSRMIWDIAKVYHEHSEIDKFAIVSGDKDFWPVIRKLHEHGKDGVLMYVEGSEADILRKTAKKIGWKTYSVPPYTKARSR